MLWKIRDVGECRVAFTHDIPVLRRNLVTRITGELLINDVRRVREPGVINFRLRRSFCFLCPRSPRAPLRCSSLSSVKQAGRDGNKPVRGEAVIVSAQHSNLVKTETVREDILEKVIHAVIPSNLLDSKTKYYINPTGRFVVGGPQGDCGLTGRKIIVDTYGGVGSHGGGAFSGKDPTKVDRSASYMARHVAKNIVASGLADKVELQVAYAIGVADPVSIMADTMD